MRDGAHKGYFMATRSAFWALSWVPVAITFTQTVGQPVWVQGRSMQPALNPDENLGARDMIVMQKYGLRSPDAFQRGDVVVLRSPSDPKKILIKRVVGIQGDIVEPRPSSGYPKDHVRLPASHLWVEGDYVHSLDSNDFGPVSSGLVMGKARLIVWPPSRWGKIEVKPDMADGRVSH